MALLEAHAAYDLHAWASHRGWCAWQSHAHAEPAANHSMTALLRAHLASVQVLVSGRR